MSLSFAVKVDHLKIFLQEHNVCFHSNNKKDALLQLVKDTIFNTACLLIFFLYFKIVFDFNLLFVAIPVFISNFKCAIGIGIGTVGIVGIGIIGIVGISTISIGTSDITNTTSALGICSTITSTIHLFFNFASTSHLLHSNGV